MVDKSVMMDKGLTGMEMLKKYGWKVLVGIGILCLLIAAALVYMHMTTPPAENSGGGKADTEHSESSEKTNNGSAIKLPEV